MKKNIYAVRDAKVGFLSPTVDVNDNVAIRNFSFGVLEARTVVNFAKADFDLFQIGEYDDESGRVTAVKPPRLVVSGASIE